MKIMSLIMKNKLVILIAVLLISIVLLAVAWDLGYILSDDGDNSTITMTIKEVGTDIGWTGTIDIEEQSFLGGAQVSMTTIGADILALNPNGIYTIDFDLLIITDGDTTLRSTIKGTLGGIPGAGMLGTAYTLNQEGKDHMTQSQVEALAGQETEVTFPAYANGGFEYLYVGGVWSEIRGSDVDGSVFHLDIEASGYNADGEWSVGTVDADITLNEGEIGTITITIGNVIVTTAE